jgi:hypothetical protein
VVRAMYGLPPNLARFVFELMVLPCSSMDLLPIHQGRWFSRR